MTTFRPKTTLRLAHRDRPLALTTIKLNLKARQYPRHSSRRTRRRDEMPVGSGHLGRPGPLMRLGEAAETLSRDQRASARHAPPRPQRR